MKPIILVIVMAACTMYLALHNTGNVDKPAIPKIAISRSDTVTTNTLLNDQYMIQGIWTKDLLW